MPSATIVTKAYLQELLKNMGYARTAEMEDAVQDILAALAAKAAAAHTHTLDEISDYAAPYTKEETEELIARHTAEQIAKIVADAPESFDTLKELSDWIEDHQSDAGTMNSAIAANASAIEANAAAIQVNAQAIEAAALAVKTAEENLSALLQSALAEQDSKLAEAEKNLAAQIGTKSDKSTVNAKLETINNQLALMATEESFKEARAALQEETAANAKNIELNAAGIAENTLAIEANATAIQDNAAAIATISANMVDRRQVMYATGDAMAISKSGTTELAVIDLEKGTYLVFVETTITGANYSRAEIFGSHYLLNMPTQGISVFACKTLSRAKELAVTFTPVENLNDSLRTTGTKVTAVKIG